MLIGIDDYWVVFVFVVDLLRGPSFGVLVFRYRYNNVKLYRDMLFEAELSFATFTTTVYSVPSTVSRRTK